LAASAAAAIDARQIAYHNPHSSRLVTPAAARYFRAALQDKEPHVPDTIGYRKRIGIVVPSTNTTVQPETESLRLPGVTCHTARVTIKERPLNTEEAFLEHMQMMRDGIGVAIDQIMTADLDHLILGIALETFWGGVAAAGKLEADLAQRAGVGVTMGSSAMVAALEKFGVRKLAILTPHQPRGDEMVRAYFLEAGFEVVRLNGLKCATPRLIAQVPLADIRNALRELDGDDVEAMVTVGTALPAASVAAEAERWLGKPVLAVNVVSFWHALRSCGVADRIYGHGQVLEEF
jgi:maleate isomerase